MPFDLEELDLAKYEHFAPRWQNWASVKAACANYATVVFDRVAEFEEGLEHQHGEGTQVAP